MAFGGAMGAGALVGPLLPATATATGDSSHTEHDASDEQETPTNTAHAPSGLQISQDGYTLGPVEVPDKAGQEESLSFRVLGPDAEPLTAFTESHDKRMHLIVVGRDMTGFQHVHPEMADDGTWSIPLELDTPGPYRMFADFVPQEHGEGLTLGADLSIPGDHESRPLPEHAPTAEVDGYTVTLDGELVPGRTNELTLTVSKDSEEVTGLVSYLGAYGHLVALRDGDLAYLHVHPEGEPGDGVTGPGPDITFQAEVPSTGDYRLFLDFKHDGEVHTAEFTAIAGSAVDGSDAPAEDQDGAHDEDDGAESGHSH
ncbi:hypothetical protein [Nocardiopsis metallicus]|uniref:Secreted protein n=1 Tax=Nocardiopsis metallicus TaxID=179819 RepID=A0A840WGE7_9ACTN|nr:hypothetical protein [Nocardiopsis metallicus]MBB5494523.1 hypothetical protein [Nocardiopsis metallicus]